MSTPSVRISSTQWPPSYFNLTGACFYILCHFAVKSVFDSLNFIHSFVIEQFFTWQIEVRRCQHRRRMRPKWTSRECVRIPVPADSGNWLNEQINDQTISFNGRSSAHTTFVTISLDETYRPGYLWSHHSSYNKFQKDLLNLFKAPTSSMTFDWVLKSSFNEIQEGCE